MVASVAVVVPTSAVVAVAATPVVVLATNPMAGMKMVVAAVALTTKAQTKP